MEAVWRLSSVLVGIPVLVVASGYPARRRAITGQPTPRNVRVSVTTILSIGVAFLIVATGILHERSGPTFMAAMTAFLAVVLVAWLQALSVIRVPETH